MKIGIFDSGVGGLTVAKAIASKLPFNDIVYFGDSIHLPYGNKSVQNVLKYSRDNVKFLIAKKCEIIVIACNTSTAIAIEFLKKRILSIAHFWRNRGGGKGSFKKKAKA